MVCMCLVFRNSPGMGGVIGGQHLKRAVVEVAMVEFKCCLCNCKDINNAYLVVAGWMQRF